MPDAMFDPKSLAHHAALLRQYEEAHAPAKTQENPRTSPLEKPAKKKEAKWPYALMIGGQAADVGTTMGALYGTGGKFKETNPMGLKAVMAIKAAGVPLAAYLMKRLHKKGDDKSAKIVGAVLGIAGAIPGAINATRMAKAK